MRDLPGLVELGLYGIVSGLTLPLLGQLSEFSPVVAITLAILILLPAPVWLASLRFPVSDRVMSLLAWHCTVTWGSLILVAFGLAVFATYRWLLGL